MIFLDHPRVDAADLSLQDETAAAPENVWKVPPSPPYPAQSPLQSNYIRYQQVKVSFPQVPPVAQSLINTDRKIMSAAEVSGTAADQEPEHADPLPPLPTSLHDLPGSFDGAYLPMRPLPPDCVPRVPFARHGPLPAAEGGGRSFEPLKIYARSGGGAALKIGVTPAGIATNPPAFRPTGNCTRALSGT